MNYKTLLILFFLYVSKAVFGIGGVLPGAGTDINPYRVEDYADLKVVGIGATYTKAKVYKLAANIDASPSAAENGGLGFIPIGTSAAQFTGKFHGCGKTISNLTIKRVTDNIGLFGYLNTNAVIDSLGMIDCYIKGNRYVGAVVGYCRNSTVTSCYNKDSVIAITNYVGGVVGYGYNSSINSCWNEGAVKATNLYAGGVVGYAAAGSISNCYNLGSISAVESAGGIVGYTALVGVLTVNINNCYNIGAVNTSLKQAGGIVGRTTNGSISNCFNYGNISGVTYAGGLASYTSGTIVANCCNVGSISGDLYIGGLIGNTSGGTITKSYSTGDVLGESFIGGFAGYLSSTVVRNTYTTGDVNGNTSSIGGYTGQTFSATLDTCYSVGLLLGASNTGGFIGTNFNGIILNSYFNTETTGTTIDIGFELTPASPIPGLNIAQMKNSASINTFDYTTIWGIRNDSIYPAIRSINNAPFAYNDTINVSAGAMTTGIDFSSFFMDNDFDYETLQDSLVFKVKNISNGTTDSISNMYFLPSATNGDIITLSYRIGEKNALLPDTLWGNTARIIARMANTAPQFTSTTLITNEDAVTTFKLGVVDADNDSIIMFSILNTSSHGSSVLNNDSLIYSPDTNFFGTDSVYLQISDGVSQTSAWIKITVLPVNDAPVVRDTLINWVAGLALSLQLPFTDVDDISALGHIYVSPSNGIASINTLSLGFTSSPFYVGKDTIQWFATDPSNLSSDTVLLIVNLSGSTLSISHDTLEFESVGGTVNYVTITSNTAWTAVASESWVSVSPSSLIGNSNLLIVVDNHNDTIAREATITFTAAGVAPQVLRIIHKKKIFVTIKPLSGSFESCDDTQILLNYIKKIGNPIEYRILYDAESLAAGFTNTSYTNLPGGSSGTIAIDLPLSAPYGSYTANLQLRNILGIESDYYLFTFYKSLPESYLVNDPSTLLKIDNQEGYSFIGYQWYKDGVLLPNETKAFYTDMEGFDGDYKVKLWTSTGDSLITCSKYFYSYAISNKIARVYPNPVHQNETFTIEFSDPIDRKFSEVDIRIYDPTGKLAYSAKSNTGKTQVSFNNQPGIYVIHLILDIDEEYSFFLMVIR